MPYSRYSPTEHGRDLSTQNNDNDTDPDDDMEPEIFGDFVVKPRYPQHNKNKTTRTSSVHKKEVQNQQCAPYIPPEILDIICLFVDQTTLCRSLRLVSRTWSTIAKRHVDQKGSWTLGPQQDEDRLLADIEHGLINVLELNYKDDLPGHRSNHAISSTGRMEPYHEWPWAWSKIVALLLGNSSDGMDDTQPAVRNNCLMHRIERLTVKSTTIWDPVRVPALLPSMQWIRELELDALDCSTTIELFPILDLCSNLASLSIRSTSGNANISVQWSSETNDLPEMELPALAPLLKTHLSLQDRASISFQTYRLLHFSSRTANIQHGAINNLLDACPRLQSCKILQSNISDLEGAAIHDYSELSNITKTLYRRAALVCPQLAEFHLPPIGPWDSTNDPNGHESGMLTLKLAQEWFPQTRFFSLQCCISPTWRPSHDIRHLLGQLTHIEIDTEAGVDLEVFNRMLGYTYSLLHLSTPSIRYRRMQRSIVQHTTDEAMAPFIARWTGSHSPKQVRLQFSWRYGWTHIYNRHYLKNLERIKKKLRREKCLLERRLMAPFQWRCYNLQTLDLGLGEASGHQTTFEYIVRACPRLVELTLHMREFWLSDNWHGFHGHTGSHTAKRSPRPPRPILSLGSLSAVLAEGNSTTGRAPSRDHGLPYLRRLTIVTVDIPGILHKSDLNFMMMQDGSKRNVSAIVKTCYWPQLEYFSIKYRDLPHVWDRGMKVYDLECLVNRMRVIRPMVFIDFRHSDNTH